MNTMEQLHLDFGTWKEKIAGNPAFRAKMPELILIHSVNPCGAANMRAFLQNHGFAVRWIPFSC
jgi:hypothetical protein